MPSSRCNKGLSLFVSIAALALNHGSIPSATAAGVSLRLEEPAFNAPNPAMFVVRDDDTTVYLFGTINYLPCVPQTDPPICATGVTPSIRAAIARSDEIWLAYDPSEELGAPLYAARGMFRDGSVLSDYIPPDEMSVLVETLARVSQLSTDVEMLRLAVDLMLPWTLSVLLHSTIVNADDWGGNILTQISETATSYAIPVRGLQAAEELMSPAWSNPIEFQVADLRLAVAYLMRGIDLAALYSLTFSELWHAWSSGQLDRYNALTAESPGSWTYEAFAAVTGLSKSEFAAVARQIEDVYPEKLHWVRQASDARARAHHNLELVSTIEGILARPGVFFVGLDASHLAGEFGLPTLLEEAGANVERVQ